MNENGLVLGIASGLSKSADNLANLKTTSALIYALAAQQAKANKWNDALIANTQGQIIESTIANLFWVKDEKIYTPPLSSGCIAGVMRAHVMQELLKRGIEVVETILDEEALVTADEVFLTNAIRGIKWVGTIENQTFTNRYIKQVCALY